MAENPNIIATDDEGNELADNDVEVNGIIPGSGGGSSVFSDDDSDGLYEQDKDGFDVPTVKQQQTRYTPTEISGNYTTAGESVIYADSSGGALTVTLASADATDGNVVEIYDVGEAAGTNAITIATEGTESINPGGKSSIDISLNGGFVKLRCRAGNWFTDRNRQSNQSHANSVNADDQTINTSLTYGSHDIGAILEATASGNRIETGSVSHNDPGAASDGTWDTRTQDALSTSFSSAFASAPTVFEEVDGYGSRGYAFPVNVSTTGFDSRWTIFASDGGGNPNALWVAVGED